MPQWNFLGLIRSIKAKPIPRSLIQVGDVVQINPESDPTFGACFLLVDKVSHNYVRGFVSVPKEKGQPPAELYYRAAIENIVLIGVAHWVPEDFGGAS